MCLTVGLFRNTAMTQRRQTGASLFGNKVLNTHYYLALCHVPVAGERRAAVGGRQLEARRGDGRGKITPLEPAFVRQLVEWLSFSTVLSDGREGWLGRARAVCGGVGCGCVGGREADACVGRCVKVMN